MSLAAHDLTWAVAGRPIVRGVTLSIAPGGFTGLLGPNGSGKSTLLRMLAGLLRPHDGGVRLDGRDLREIPRRHLARRLAVVAQETSTELDMTVMEAVLLGRIPHRSRLAATSEEDHRKAHDALARCGLAGLGHRRWSSLSGGERQRVNIARALAQEPTELLLDEPTNHLDIAHRLAVLELLAATPATVVAALHDLELAASYCDHLLLLEAGRVVAAGTPAQVLTEERIARVYRVRAAVTHSPEGRPHIRYLSPLPA